MASCRGFDDLHPLQEDEGAQGALELIVAAPGYLAEIAGGARRLAPAGGRLAGR